MTQLQPQGGVDSERAADAMQAAALVLVTNVVAAGVTGVLVLALSIGDQPTPFLLTAGALAAGSLASSFIPGRWIHRRHPRLTLIGAAITACTCLYLSVLALGPWPDVLGNDVGQLRFIVEMVKGPFALVIAAAAGFGVLRYARHNRQQDRRRLGVAG